MANEVATTNGHGTISPWEAYANEGGASAIAGDLLTYKKGKWARGQDKLPVSTKAKFLCNMHEIWHGWMKWQDAKPVDYRMHRISDGPRASRNDLDDLDHPTDQDPWQMTDRMVMRDTDGSLLTFSTSSGGGRGALRDLCRDFAKGIAKHPGQYPVVTVDSGSFESKQYGEVMKPVFKIVGWDHWDDKSADFQPAVESQKSLREELDDTIPF